MASQSTPHTFIFEPPEEYICTVCSRVMTEPHLTKLLWSAFFASAASSDGIRVEDSSSVRTAEVGISITSSICPSNVRSTSLMYIAQIRKRGAKLETELGQLEAHLQKCDYVELSCTQGCKMKVFRKDIRVA